MKIKAFRALRPVPETVDRVACPPYDTVDRVAARVLAAGKPDSFLHVVRPEINLPEGHDPYDDAVYETAVANLRRLQDNGAMVRENVPCFYLYRQRTRDHVQRGVVVCCSVREYTRNLIRAHEHTRADKEEDRTRHIRATNANTGPVFLTYRPDTRIRELMDNIEQDEEPLLVHTADDYCEHTLWRIPARCGLPEAFERVLPAYVADGHHRLAAAVRVAAERDAQDPSHLGGEESNWFLGVLVPSDEVRVLAYNRYVRDLNGHSPEELLAAIGKRCTVTEDAPPEPRGPQRISMYLQGRWYGLQWALYMGSDAVSSIDVSFLHDCLIEPLLGVRNPRTDPRIGFVGGVNSASTLQEMVNTGEAAVAFSLHPVPVAQMMAVADSGRSMPPKSTWFEPKLRSGLLVHLLTDDQ